MEIADKRLHSMEKIGLFGKAYILVNVVVE
jgi:hypothetical protein